MQITLHGKKESRERAATTRRCRRASRTVSPAVAAARDGDFSGVPIMDTPEAQTTHVRG
jgi:hypothetical protein